MFLAETTIIVCIDIKEVKKLTFPASFSPLTLSTIMLLLPFAFHCPCQILLTQLQTITFGICTEKKKKNQLADKKIINPHKYVIGCFKIKALQLRTYPRINLAKIKVSLKVPTQQRFMIEVHRIIICGKENVE